MGDKMSRIERLDEIRLSEAVKENELAESADLDFEHLAAPVLENARELANLAQILKEEAPNDPDWKDAMIAAVLCAVRSEIAEGDVEERMYANFYMHANVYQRITEGFDVYEWIEDNREWTDLWMVDFDSEGAIYARSLLMENGLESYLADFLRGIACPERGVEYSLMDVVPDCDQKAYGVSVMVNTI